MPQSEVSRQVEREREKKYYEMDVLPFPPLMQHKRRNRTLLAWRQIKVKSNTHPLAMNTGYQLHNCPVVDRPSQIHFGERRQSVDAARLKKTEDKLLLLRFLIHI